MKVSWLLWGVFWLYLSSFDQARAIVFFSQGNDANLSSPAGLNLPWDNVVQMRSTSGPIGSGVYVGNRYVLTAAHVAPLTSVRVGFVDYALDSSSAVNIGTSDMKLVRLANDPGLGSVRLNTSAASDTSDARRTSNASRTGWASITSGTSSSSHARRTSNASRTCRTSITSGTS